MDQTSFNASFKWRYFRSEDSYSSHSIDYVLLLLFFFCTMSLFIFRVPRIRTTIINVFILKHTTKKMK